MAALAIAAWSTVVVVASVELVVAEVVGGAVVGEVGAGDERDAVVAGLLIEGGLDGVARGSLVQPAVMSRPVAMMPMTAVRNLFTGIWPPAPRSRRHLPPRLRHTPSRTRGRRRHDA